MPFTAVSASSVLYCPGRFNTSAHVITKQGQENHEATGHLKKKNAVCACPGVSGRRSQHPGRTWHQPVCARQSSCSALKNADARLFSKPSLEPPGPGCTGDFVMQTGLRTTALELFVSPSGLLEKSSSVWAGLEAHWFDRDKI